MNDDSLLIDFGVDDRPWPFPESNPTPAPAPIPWWRRLLERIFGRVEEE